MPRHATPFTTKEERFIAEYLVDGNGVRAATAAGYSAGNARSQAHQLLKRPHVSRAINAGKKRITKKLDITAERVLSRLSHLSSKAEAARQFTASVNAEKLIGQHLKMFTEKHEHGGIGGGPVQMHVTSADEAL